MKPRIGLTTTPAAVDGRRVEQVNQTYVDAVVRAGGLPFVLPVLDPDDAASALLALDGLLLTGGGDVEPSLYGALPVAEVYGLDPARDTSEIALVRAAARARLPVLGICRGAQVLNVALGGSLVQHVPAVTGVDHCRRDRAYEFVHRVRVDPQSVLAGVAGTDVPVNSLHHQAVDAPGAGLRAVAWSEDGIIEGIESDPDGDSTRLLGVQWHPELLAGHDAHERLFAWLVTEAAQPLAADRPPIATPT
jgi:putative glutamine amidotransferase